MANRGRPKRPEGTTSNEWPQRISALFNQHCRLTVAGVARYLNDIDYAFGGRGISDDMIYLYRSTSQRRNPPQHFKDAWETFEERIASLANHDIIIKEKDGQHVLAILDGQPETIWLPPSAEWILHQCEACGVSFAGQWNAKRCPACR